MELSDGWLEREIVGWKIISFCALCLVFCSAWGSATISVFGYLGVHVSEVLGAKYPILVWYFPFQLLWWVALEEFCFRCLPLLLVATLFERDGGERQRIISVSIFTSLIFGAAHGNWPHVFIQGMDGLVFSLIFLKCGGFQKKWGKALLVSTAAHYALFATMIVGLLLQGRTHI